MALDDGYDNSFSFDESDDGDMTKDVGQCDALTCKKCAKEFLLGTKGSSELKELCSKCHSEQINDLLALDEIADDSALSSLHPKDKVAEQIEVSNYYI
jgi:hypothetical protein